MNILQANEPIVLTKLKESKSNKYISVGDEKEGVLLFDVRVGLNITMTVKNEEGVLKTSIIKNIEIINDNYFIVKTRNSSYGIKKANNKLYDKIVNSEK